jgi:hypothetical protein
VTSLLQEVEVVVKLDEGMSIVTFERLYALNESTIRLVEKHKDETSKSAKSSAQSRIKSPCVSCFDPFLANLENTLCV